MPVLTSLRFIAAADVVVTHYGFHTRHRAIGSLAHAGYQAVTFFFLLSGFILTYVYHARAEADGVEVDRRAFWIARFARLAPIYYLALLVALPSLLDSAPDVGTGAPTAGVGSIVLVPLFLQAWYPPLALAWNGPAWSLSVEALFYAAYPWLANALRAAPRWRVVIVAYAAVVVSAAGQAWILGSDPASAPLSRQNFALFFPLFHVPQFVLGVAIGRVFLFGRQHSRRYHTLVFAVAATAALSLIAARDVLPGWVLSNAVLTPLFGMTIFGASRAHRVWPLSSRAAVLLGEASYAMYLLHLPVKDHWARMGGRLLGAVAPPAVSFIAYFGLVVVASLLAFKLVELPLRRRIARWYGR